MGDQKKRHRTGSMIKLENQKKEAKLWYEEANNHVKLSNLHKAICSYNKRTGGDSQIKFNELEKYDFNKILEAMADTSSHTLFDKTSSIAREAELLQSFVRITVADNEEGPSSSTHFKHPIPAKPEKQGSAAANEDKNKEAVPVRTKTGKKRIKSPSKDSKKEPKKKPKKKYKKPLPPTTRQEEVFCDKDRAAAVNLGLKDIKQSLKIKRKEDRSKRLLIPDEAEPGTFLALGNYEMSRGDLQIGLNFISKALELDPYEKNALVARSKCYILLGQPESALKDAETALSIDKGFMKGIYQKAEALYYLGDFEHSLMYYHRGLHIRPDHEGFKLGVHKAQKAIENALGSKFPSGAKETSARGDVPKDKSSLSSNTPNSNCSSKSTKRTMTTGKSGRKSRLLRELKSDKDYLDNLINNPNIKCKFKEDDDTIENCIKETVDYLNTRQEFWRQQLPAHLK